MTKEQAYDDKIYPLMGQIIAICAEHKIPMLASFTLDLQAELLCTTTLLDHEWEPHKRLVDAANSIVHGARSPVMLTVRDGDRVVSSIAVVD